MARYTIIGASGFVGSRLLATLRAEGEDVFVPGREDPRLFSEDLGRIFYCAGLTADYAERWFDTIEAHVALLARLLRGATFERLVYMSSTRLYDSLGLEGGAETDALRLDPHDPRHLYDLSKALGENLCLTRSFGRASALRLSCVFDWRPGGQGFLSEWLQAARRSRQLHIASPTGYVRDYVYVDDVVASAKAVIDGGDSAVFNVASGANTSNAELAEIFRDHGWDVELGPQSPRQEAASCQVTRLVAAGVRPRSTRSALRDILTLREFNETD